MIPLSPTAQFQNQLAQAVRQGNAAPINHHAPERLAVYARLIRNNLFGFINRCFCDSQQAIGQTHWQALLEDFVQHGQAHSPYFQDIAGEFLRFCREQEKLTSPFLHWLDYEYSQLCAEVAQTPKNQHFEWDDTTVFHLSPAALLRHYPHHFVDHTPDLHTICDGYTVIWQNSVGEILSQCVEQIDYFLLHHVQESPTSFHHLVLHIQSIMPANSDWQDIIWQAWHHWIDADVLLPNS